MFEEMSVIKQTMETKQNKIADDFAKLASHHKKNSIKELNQYAEQIIGSHKNDKLLQLLEISVNRGYSGFEWIDFLGCGVMDKNFAITWANKIIKNQNLEHIIEPYFNNSTWRLGIVLSRKVLKKHELLKENTFIPLPLELRDWKL